MDADNVDADHYLWRPPGESTLFGGCLMLHDGTVNMDQLWALPELFDLLASEHFPARTEAQLYRDSLALMLPLVLVLETNLALAALLAPTAQLAAGGDVDQEAVLDGPMHVPPLETFECEDALVQQGLQAEEGPRLGEGGTELFAHVQAIMTSRRGELSNATTFERLRQLAAARDRGA